MQLTSAICRRPSFSHLWQIVFASRRRLWQIVDFYSVAATYGSGAWWRHYAWRHQWRHRITHQR